jgi:branched-chain amino acid aminotransferase
VTFLFYLDSVNYICVNGKIIEADQPTLRVDNRGYRYGDGLFETLRVCHGQIPLEVFHFERLFNSLALLQFELPAHFTRDKLLTEVLSLCKKNKSERNGRIRLSISRGHGGLFDDNRSLLYIIESWPLDEGSLGFNENGLIIDIFPDGRKSCDRFSGLKSSSAQLYALAAIFAKTHQFNDCLILNTSGGIADSTIANIFLVKDGVIYTPSLKEGCIDGVMRRFLMEKLQASGFRVQETRIEHGDLLAADEIFLTNAIKGIRWVKQFRDRSYTNERSAMIYHQFVQTIFT